jgi:hypothetical protein
MRDDTRHENYPRSGRGRAAFAGLLVSIASRLPLAQLPDIPLPLVELVLGGWLVLAPVAVYLAFSRE